MKYLIIQLCDSSVSFCNYLPSENERLIPLQSLEDSLLWGIKNGLNIQILFPKYEMPLRYQEIIGKYEHTEIREFDLLHDADIFTLRNWCEINFDKQIHNPVILHLQVNDFLKNYIAIGEILHLVQRLNICFIDANNFRDSQIQEYEKALTFLSSEVEKIYKKGNQIQLNLITDRIMLTEMNNCNAGIDSITVAPDGNFYICPAFYLNGLPSNGNIKVGVQIPNRQLLKLNFAPICRECDAFHCRRCIWLNKRLTREVNTPSHQQCLMSHIERKVARNLLLSFRKHGNFAPKVNIPVLDYLDPFEKIINKK